MFKIYILCFLIHHALGDFHVSVLYYPNSTSRGIDITDKNSLEKLNLEYPIKIIIHGYMNGPTMSPVMELGEAYFAKNSPVNIFYVDYEETSFGSYAKIRALVTKLGDKISLILKKNLFNRYPVIRLSQVHVIGHSLGAHIAGSVGKHFQGELGRITGLDPALPLFAISHKDRLNKSNAKFVDVIHTAGTTIGDERIMGHADFYPNGGRSQPKCELLDGIAHFCSHYMSSYYFANSILHNKVYPSRLCSLKTILSDSNSCRKGSGLFEGFMGEKASSRLRGIFIVNTNENRNLKLDNHDIAHKLIKNYKDAFKKLLSKRKDSNEE